MSRFSRIDAALARVYHAVGNLVGITIGLFAVVITLDLVMRLLNVGNLPGMQEIVEYALYIGVFLAAPWVLRLGGHIRVDLLLGALPKRISVGFERALDLFGLIVCLVLLYYGVQGMIEAWVNDSVQRKTYVVDDWFLLAFLNLSFILLAIEFLFRMIRAGVAPEAAAEKSDEAGF